MDQLFYQKLPQVDDVIELWLDDASGAVSPEDYRGNSSRVILLAGVEEEELFGFMERVNCRGEELRGYAAGWGSSWDVSVKPILLFESLAGALQLHRMIQTEHTDDIWELVQELQLDYNEPWGRVKRIGDEAWNERYLRWRQRTDGEDMG